MTSKEVRQKYLEFFKARGHAEIPSSSLIPENDPTTLFTGSGMQPMIPYLMGKDYPKGGRVVDLQKCFRAQDINDVGDNRHTTLFEMMGNWSLGDYFKEEQIAWMFEYITKEIGLDPSRIYITCFRGNDTLKIAKDEEAARLWQAEFKKININAKTIDDAESGGMKDGRIFFYDESKNWWSRSGMPSNMPVGEIGGTNSEMFWDFGTGRKIHEKSAYKDQPCHPNCDCGRFVEIGNNVFMEFIKTENGFKSLPKKNVDFGGGLERMTAATIDNPDIFMIDIFDKVRENLEKLSGKKYGVDETHTYSFRIIMDHMRAATFLVADGAIPSNKDQGYYTRRLIRRAVRHTNVLGMPDNICNNIAGFYVDIFKEFYPVMEEKKAFILEQICIEEDKFRKTMSKGLREFEKIIKDKKDKLINGEEVFKLYDTYGFPMEITNELAVEKGFEIDKDGFCNAFTAHQDKSRKGSEKKFKGGLADCSVETTRYHTATHLLQEALRKVLGDHVGQKGSNNTPERMRFDFSHPEKMTPGQINEVQTIVNDIIQSDRKVIAETMSLEDAKNSGALYIEGETYPDLVSVYAVDKFSKEICGGPHVKSTGELGKFRILKEESSSAGVRRIKAVLE